jgi:hypothetical protein
MSDRSFSSRRQEADADRPLTESDLAQRWHKSVRTLKRWRAEGYGPAYLRIGGTVLYRLSDVTAFEDRVRQTGKFKP